MKSGGATITRSSLSVMFVAALVAGAAQIEANAQSTPRRVALKNGETIELGTIYYVSNCRSVLIGLPEIEVLDGPPELTLSIRAEAVLPRRQGCAARVPGGTLLLMAKGVTEKTEAILTYRLNYKTKDGPRQGSNTYLVSLFP